MAKAINFGTFNFPSKAAAIKNIQERINKYEFNQSLNSEDRLFFESLFLLHDEYDEKVGNGIYDIQIRRDFANNRSLCIIQNDGHEMIISWRHCVQPTLPRTVLSRAFRRAVKHLIMDFKRSQIAMNVVCPNDHTLLTYENSHVAYVDISFDDIFNKFLSSNNLQISDVILIDPDANDPDQRGIISDKELCGRWITFHGELSKLCLLSASYNLKRS